MVTAIILSGGTGQRMRTKGLPKQFLTIYGKPIICYTVAIFDRCPEVDQIIVPSHKDWIEHTEKIFRKEDFTKPIKVVEGGSDRSGSVMNGLRAIEDPKDGDVVLIHDGVRPLIEEKTIIENIRVAREKGNAMTVRRNIETVVYTEGDSAKIDDFKNRDFTYTLTAPQTFRVKEVIDIYEKAIAEGRKIPLDTSLLYAELGKEIFLVTEEGKNIKITTPEDYYYLKSYLEFNENQNVFGV